MQHRVDDASPDRGQERLHPDLTRIYTRRKCIAVQDLRGV
jgi:hypothetical protein